MRRHAMLLALSLLAAALAGCAEDAGDGATGAAADTGARSPDVRVEDVPQVDVDAAPHVHDYWQGRERVTLLDAEYAVAPEEALMWGLMSTWVLGEPMFGGAFVDMPEGALVFEGTGRLEITASWTDPSITGMRFLHRHAGSGDIQPWVSTPNGETVALEVAPEMTDMPHAQTSRWAFLFAAEGTPAVAVGALRVKMDIVKTRDVAEWPGHPDLWAGRAELPVADAEGSTASGAQPPGWLEQDPWAEPADAVRASAPVPMGTANLTVTVHVLDVEPDLDVERLDLRVRTAADLQFQFEWMDAASSVSDDGLTWTWVVPVEMEQTDNPYATSSAWAFRVTPRYASELPLLPFCDGSCQDAELRYHVTAVAHKAPEPQERGPA